MLNIISIEKSLVQWGIRTRVLRMRSRYSASTLTIPDYVKLLKFADDSTIQGLITDSDELYRSYVDSFTDWCDQHFLLLNVKKTKEMIFDFRIKKDPILPLT